MRYSKELLYKVAYAFLQANGSDEYESKNGAIVVPKED